MLEQANLEATPALPPLAMHMCSSNNKWATVPSPD